MGHYRSSTGLVLGSNHRNIRVRTGAFSIKDKWAEVFIIPSKRHNQMGLIEGGLNKKTKR